VFSSSQGLYLYTNTEKHTYAHNTDILGSYNYIRKLKITIS
jgi:shikimate 5-dehydrogenase